MLFNEDKIIYSLFDYSGNWSKPYRENGYKVIQIDLKLGIDVRWLEIPTKQVYGILAAPPCNDFTLASRRLFKEKDADGRTLKSLELIGALSRFILATNPHFWAVENPVGRLYRWFGKSKFTFTPCEFGDPYNKRTQLWGRFNNPKVISPVEPVKTRPGHHSLDEYLRKVHGRKFNKKNRSELRSNTPLGFAYAFYEANK